MVGATGFEPVTPAVDRQPSELGGQRLARVDQALVIGDLPAPVGQVALEQHRDRESVDRGRRAQLGEECLEGCLLYTSRHFA